MESLPCSGCRGMCCGPVPVTNKELKNIRKKIKSMPLKKKLELKNQNRLFGTCIFFDMDQDRCGIHSARPAVCQAFGYHSNLVCFKNPKAASMGEWVAKDKPIGILSTDFTWKDF